MKRIGLIGPALMVVCGVGAIATASASAQPFEFRAETYPAEWRGINTNPQHFSYDTIKFSCYKATFNTNEERAVNPTMSTSRLVV